MTTPQPPARGGRYQDPPTDLEWPKALTVASAAGSGLLIGQAVLLTGWAVADLVGTGGALAYLYTGDSSTGQLVAAIGMVSNGGSSAGPGWPGIPCPNGLWHEVGSGSYTGAVWVIPLPQGAM